jgi:hypothetical protein
MRAILALLAAACLAACGAVPERADPGSDAPETRVVPARGYPEAATYPAALAGWRSADDVNAWIGARFQYDFARALQLSETQRQKNGRMPIRDPETFFREPRGVCVDLSRFAVETLRAIDPATNARYVVIEFDPVEIAGNTLRRHWIASFERDGQRHFFADSKRPGHVAGPYASLQDFAAEYAAYRGRRIVSVNERASYERTLRTRAAAR